MELDAVVEEPVNNPAGAVEVEAIGLETGSEVVTGVVTARDPEGVLAGNISVLAVSLETDEGEYVSTTELPLSGEDAGDIDAEVLPATVSELAVEDGPAFVADPEGDADRYVSVDVVKLAGEEEVIVKGNPMLVLDPELDKEEYVSADELDEAGEDVDTVEDNSVAVLDADVEVASVSEARYGSAKVLELAREPDVVDAKLGELGPEAEDAVSDDIVVLDEARSDTKLELSLELVPDMSTGTIDCEVEYDATVPAVLVVTNVLPTLFTETAFFSTSETVFEPALAEPLVEPRLLIKVHAPLWDVTPVHPATFEHCAEQSEKSEPDTVLMLVAAGKYVLHMTSYVLPDESSY
ncbi:hypothetical protein LTR85_005839 [Meristemomyces frigidus]|nr:hypothetical protein LTR85_005839 [Meristemomyces frigidus]